jgi:hypothetical protein
LENARKIQGESMGGKKDVFPEAAGGPKKADNYLDLLMKDYARREKEEQEMYEYLAKLDKDFLATDEAIRVQLAAGYEQYYADREKDAAEYWEHVSQTEKAAVDQETQNRLLLAEGYAQYYADRERDAAEYWAGVAKQEQEAFEKSQVKMKSQWDGVTDAFASSFQSGFFDLFKNGITSLKDVWKQFTENLVQSFMRAVAQMITQWLLFEQIQGGKDKFLGGGSGIGKIAGAIGSIFSGGGAAAAGGQYMWEPIAFAKGGSFWTQGATPIVVGEAGREHVEITPEGKKDEEQRPVINNITNIWTNDVDSFRRYMLANKDLMEGVAVNVYAEGKRFNKTVFRG